MPLDSVGQTLSIGVTTTGVEEDSDEIGDGV
jgi:hypothetical protein